MSRLIITGGRIIDPGSGRDEIGDIVCEGRFITQVGGRATIDPHDRSTTVLEAADCIVTPGLIDPHVHLREPGGEEAETIGSGANAAIAGGFTTVICMPNTNPAIDQPAMVKFVYRQAKEARRARVFPAGAVTRGRQGESLAEIGLMMKAGAVAYTDDGDAVANTAVMQKALMFIKHYGKAMMQHCQEPSLTKNSMMNSGPLATRLGLGGWPPVAEELIIERDIRLNRAIGCRYHVQHMSCKGSAALVAAARDEGQPITAEVTPHHLLLTDEACDGYNTMAKMNPPLRREEDILALRQAVKDGVVTILATDHAPHTLESKSLEFDHAPFGIVGLETALPLFVKALIEPGLIDWPRLIEMMTVNPAELCGLDGPPHKLGRLEAGCAADVTIIDPMQSWVIDSSRFVSKSTNTPFDGWSVTGRAVAVVVMGEVKMDREGRAGRPKLPEPVEPGAEPVAAGGLPGEDASGTADHAS